MRRLSIILCIASACVLLGGLSFAKGAPQEGAAAGIACCIAIYARIAQASAYNRKEGL